MPLFKYHQLLLFEAKKSLKNNSIFTGEKYIMRSFIFVLYTNY